LKIVANGIVNPSGPASSRLFSSFPSVTVLPDGRLLATYRVGSTKDSEDETVELRCSDDLGAHWSAPQSPFSTTVLGRRGSLKVIYPTLLSNGRLLGASLWVDRAAHPGRPLFNEATQGCLPMRIVLAESADLGRSWSAWRVVDTPEDIGPPSLTNPILDFPSGRLALSIESNKHYHDCSPWLQKVVYLYSSDLGQSWGSPTLICGDDTGRLMHWDQRAAVVPDGLLVTFTWTYDTRAGIYRNIERRLSRNEGRSWSTPEDLGFPDQPSHPAVFPDGRVVLAWVDRYKTQSIRARLSASPQAPFEQASEVVLHDASRRRMAGTFSGVGQAIEEMFVWNYGLPFAEALPNGEAIVLYYGRQGDGTAICWARLAL
jgi:hypothetical protein